MRSTRTDDRDVAPELRKAIERTGYYPEVVHDAVASAVAGEQVVSRQLNVRPTLTIRPGYPVRVLVTRDIVLEGES